MATTFHLSTEVYSQRQGVERSTACYIDPSMQHLNRKTNVQGMRSSVTPSNGTGIFIFKPDIIAEIISILHRQRSNWLVRVGTKTLH